MFCIIKNWIQRFMRFSKRYTTVSTPSSHLSFLSEVFYYLLSVGLSPNIHWVMEILKIPNMKTSCLPPLRSQQETEFISQLKQREFNEEAPKEKKEEKTTFPLKIKWAGREWVTLPSEGWNYRQEGCRPSCSPERQSQAEDKKETEKEKEEKSESLCLPCQDSSTVGSLELEMRNRKSTCLNLSGREQGRERQGRAGGQGRRQNHQCILLENWVPSPFFSCW